MAKLQKDFGPLSLELKADGIAQLHIKANETPGLDVIQDFFDFVNENVNERIGLLVTAGEQSTLTQEARDLVSSGDVTDKIVADAIIVGSFRHEMSSNFFIRYSHPARPTQLFTDEGEARKWLKSKIEADKNH